MGSVSQETLLPPDEILQALGHAVDSLSQRTDFIAAFYL